MQIINTHVHPDHTGGNAIVAGLGRSPAREAAGQGAGAAILFKGSGFYQTDYRSESYKKSAKADQEAAKPSSASSSSAGETGSAPSAPSSSKDAGSGAKGSKSSG